MLSYSLFKGLKDGVRPHATPENILEPSEVVALTCAIVCSVLYDLKTAFICFVFVHVCLYCEKCANQQRVIEAVVPEKFPVAFQDDKECPACLCTTNLLTLGCCHTICNDCIRLLPDKNCPKCRHIIDMKIVKMYV